MTDEPSQTSLSTELVEEEEGGPVKPFLEHLEDLRWVIIKSLVALVVGMVLCLSAAPQILAVLERPLEKAGLDVDAMKQGLGTEQVGDAGASATNATSSTNAATATNATNATSATNAVVGADSVVSTNSVAYPFDGSSEFRGIQPFDVTGGFVIILKIGFWTGLLIAFPFIFYFIADYLIPAMRRVERKYVGIACGGGTLLFIAGVALAYFFIAGISLSAFMGLNEWMGMETTVWRAESYISFIVKLMLGMGLAFELPVVVLTLVKLEVISAEFLAKGRKYMVLVNFALSAMVTPQDPMSTVMMALPLQILFEICIVVARYWDRQEKRRLKALGLD